MFTKNVGKCDRTVRIVMGIVLAGLAYHKLDGVWQVVAYVGAALGLLTGIIRYCPMYTVFGCDSTNCSCKMCGSEKCKKEEEKSV